MTEYDSGPRPLSWPLLHPLVKSVVVEEDADCEASSFIWPEDPDQKTLVPFYLSLNEYNILGSAIDVGSDIAFAEDALKVMWLWMRNMRCNVSICDLVDACITDNPATIAAIVARLMVNPTYQTYLNQTIVQVSPPAAGNVYVSWPTAAQPEPLCNAATYVVGKIRELIVAVYADLETLTPSEVLEALLGVFGWRSGPLYQLIGLLETNDETAVLAAFDAVSDSLICELIEAELDQSIITAWVATEFPPPSVLGDALTMAIGAAANDGKYAQWIAVGATLTGADCDDCGAPPPDPDCVDLVVTSELWAGEAGTTHSVGQGFIPDYNAGFNQTLLRALRGSSSGFINRIVFAFTEAPELIFIQSGDGSGYQPLTGSLGTEIEFSAATVGVGWYDRNAALGLRVGTNQTGDFEASMRLVEVCVYFA